MATNRKSRLLKYLLLAGIAVAAYSWWAYESTDPAFGRFRGDVVAKWLNDDVEMELVEDFHYVGPNGKQWTAPTGSVINGASIPSMFWSVIGGPFEGRFRNASVLHDAACDVQKDSWEDVHRMFYDACRCSRVGIGKAQTMYWAVYHFGPRWQNADAPMPTDTAEPLADKSIVAKAERYFDKKQFTPKEIEECTVEQVEAEVAKWDAAKAVDEKK
jgi:Protein of unknown function (DUF1353)